MRPWGTGGSGRGWPVACAATCAYNGAAVLIPLRFAIVTLGLAPTGFLISEMSLLNVLCALCSVMDMLEDVTHRRLSQHLSDQLDSRYSV